MLTVPPFPEELKLRKMCEIVWSYLGSMQPANRIFEPIRSYRPPAFEFFAVVPFPMLQGMLDGIGLFVTQRLDRIQTRGLARRPDAEKQADAD